MKTVTEITVTIGSNQHESDEFMRNTYCPELKQAIAAAFPDVDVEVSFTTTSPVFKVSADADEESVVERVQSIHEELWQS
jgi:hypothetical protein